MEGEKMIDRQIFECFWLCVPKIELDTLKIQKGEVQAIKLCGLGEFRRMVREEMMMSRPELYEKSIEMIGTGDSR